MTDREWMYTGFKSKSPEWVLGMKNFLEVAFSNGFLQMSCPCTKCKNKKRKDHQQMYKDIFVNGYIPNYTRWIYHGERHRVSEEEVRHQLEEFDADAGMADMMVDTRLGMEVAKEDPKETA
jgi:hypothetical protein